MAGPPTSSFAQISLLFSDLNATYPGAVTIGVLNPGYNDTLRNELDLLLDDAVPSLFGAAVTVTEALYKVGPSASGPTFVIGGPYAGGISGAPSSPQVAVLVRKDVLAVSGRFAGRFFLPAPPEGSVADQGLLTTATLNAYTSAANDFYNALDAVGCQPYVFAADSSDPRPVSAFSVQGRVATQRRRLRR